MPVRLEKTETRFVDFGRDAAGRDLVASFPLVYRYDQVIAELQGFDPHETGGVQKRVHYGYSPHPVIRIANVIDSSATSLRTLSLDADGDIWLLCHRHRDARESAAYAHAVLLGRNPGDGLAPAAIEYVTPEGHYTIAPRRPPAGAPSGLIVYSLSHDAGIATTAVDRDGDPASPEAYLFAYVPLPEGNGPRRDK